MVRKSKAADAAYMRVYRKRKAEKDKHYKMWDRILEATDYVAAIEIEKDLLNLHLKKLIKEADALQQKFDAFGDSPKELPATIECRLAIEENDKQLALTMQNYDFLSFLTVKFAKTVREITEPEKVKNHV